MLLFNFGEKLFRCSNFKKNRKELIKIYIKK